MKAKYFPIDKLIIGDSTAYDFSMYIKSTSHNDMECFKEKGCVFTSAEITIVNTSQKLYVSEDEYFIYKEYYNIFLEISEKKQEQKHISFEDKTFAIYNNASKVLNDLFLNPEAPANYEATKEVVSNMVLTVQDEEFAIKSMMKIASHDYYIHTHSINVSIYALSLGSFLGISEKFLSSLGEAALLHDLGKSKVNTEIINKNGKLNDEEFQEIKKHSLLGYTIGLKLGIKNRDVLEGIRHHHEKMDGSGYPLRMKGENIPYFARIIGICDIFDALTSRRSYKEPMNSFDALLLMKTEMKNHIDPKLLNSLIQMFR